MSARAKLYEKYNKSDIFNTSDNICLTDRQPIGIKAHPAFQKRENDIIKTPNIPRKTNQRRYNARNHESDIFNLNKSYETPMPKRTNFNDQKKSTCFDSMKDNAQFAKEIKEYASKNRGKKVEYQPDKYLHEQGASEILYNQYYDKNRNPILNNTDKSSKNMLSKMSINENSEKNEKDLFVERKKNMRNNFTKVFFNQRSINDKMRLEKETEKAGKEHKYYKSKGFTYKDNNNINENKFVEPEKPSENSAKITKQIQLQSNIFTNPNENNKNENNIDKIKERIKAVKENDYENNHSKKTYQKKEITRNKTNQGGENDRNIWGVLHSKWERSNLDWRNSETEKIFRRTYTGNFHKKGGDKSSDDINQDPFQRKMNQLQDSGNKDTINESIKIKRKYNKNTLKDKLNYTTNLDKIDEVLNEIPEIKYDKKKKIIFNQNTTGLNGETEINENFKNYNKFHKNVLKKKEVKNPTIKIMSKDGEFNRNKKKNLDKNFNNVKNHNDYTIHDFVLSYDSKAKNEKSNFDKFSENEVKLLFSKKGIHVYDIVKNQFDNGKYNVIKFKVRENEGENVLGEKMKELENDLTKKDYKICIEKDVEKEKKKNLRNVVNAPGTKVAMFVDNDGNKSKFKKVEPLQIKNNTKFSKEFNMINHHYKSKK